MSGEPPKQETFRSHLPAIAGSVTATVVSAVITSHFLGSGTKYALVGSPFVFGFTSWWAERGIRRSHAIAKAKLEAQKAKGRPLNLEETSMIEAVHKASFNWRFRGIHYRTILLLVLVSVAAFFLTVLGLNDFSKASNDNYVVPPVPTVTHTTYESPAYIPPSTVYISPSPSSPSPSPSASLSPSAAPSTAFSG